MSETTEAPSAYSYQLITDKTEKLLNTYLSEAITAPLETQQKMDCFGGAFWLWFDITRDDPNPDRDADGTRFMAMIDKFQEFEKPLQPAAAMTFEDARATLMANVATPGDYADLTDWDALRAAADAEHLQATYHLTQLEDVIRSAEIQGEDRMTAAEHITGTATGGFTAQNKTLIEAFLHAVLNDVRNNVTDVRQAAEGIAHAVSLIENGRYDEATAWLKESRKALRGDCA